MARINFIKLGVAPVIPTPEPDVDAAMETDADTARVLFSEGEIDPIEDNLSSMDVAYASMMNRKNLQGQMKKDMLRLPKLPDDKTVTTLKSIAYQPKQYSAINDPEDKNWELSGRLAEMPMEEIKRTYGQGIADKWARALKLSQGTEAVPSKLKDVLYYKNTENDTNFSNKYYSAPPVGDFSTGKGILGPFSLFGLTPKPAPVKTKPVPKVVPKIKTVKPVATQIASVPPKAKAVNTKS